MTPFLSIKNIEKAQSIYDFTETVRNDIHQPTNNYHFGGQNY